MMKELTWKFIENSKEVSGGFDIVFSHEMDSLRFFLLGTSLKSLPSFITSLLNSEGGGGDELCYLETYSNLDGGDFATGNDFEIDEVRIVHSLFDNVILKEKLFLKILYEYAMKVLEINKENKVLGLNWMNLMNDSLDKLKLKIYEDPCA
ncbi:hypothetical protein [Aquimarina mytili]|uniref:Uncharacterized protein n=1 Tax=Aquimarina mytili TaxID=874423 RepID=A0A937A1E9_9FLAO|nr:hypothetical protein [Aquimarina mytili]MBL0683255.1 hypothetical protein [Aquimarina mytili]